MPRILVAHDLASGRQLGQLDLNGDALLASAVTRDHQHAALASHTRVELRTWAGERVDRIELEGEAVPVQLALSDDLRWLAIADCHSMIRLIDRERGESRMLGSASVPISAARDGQWMHESSVSADGSRLVASCAAIRCECST